MSELKVTITIEGAKNATHEVVGNLVYTAAKGALEDYQKGKR